MVQRLVETGAPPRPAGQRPFAVLRCLARSLSWKVMIDDLELDDAEAAEAPGWAVRTLLRESKAAVAQYSPKGRDQMDLAFTVVVSLDKAGGSSKPTQFLD